MTDPHRWQLAPDLRWDLNPTAARARVLGILNATPDSFSDGGRHLDPRLAADAAQAMIEAGADGLDIGGESTRPGAEPVSEQAQIDRVAPVIRAIRDRGLDAPITIDTTRAAVARAALDAGATAINDVSAGTDDPGMLPLAAERRVGVILMHRLRAPSDDRYSDAYDTPPEYDDVVHHVRDQLSARLSAAVESGCDPEQVLLDPGLGFGKTVEQNLDLVRRTEELLTIGRPLLGGASRKSFVGRVSVTEGEPPSPIERLGGSIAFTLAQRAGGVMVFRVHDAAVQAQALRAWEAIEPKSR